MHDRFVLLKRESGLNDRECLLLDGWTQNYPDLGVAYRLKEDFYGIYENASSPQEAMRAYDAWNRAVVPQVRDAYADLTRACSTTLRTLLPMSTRIPIRKNGQVIFGCAGLVGASL
jgi:hypothetical protein